MSNKNAAGTKKPFKMPHPFVMLVVIIILVSIATYFIPTGVYDRVVNEAGKSVVDPNSYHAVEKTPVTFMQLITSIHRGFTSAGSIIAMTIIVGGAIEILKKTGIIIAGVEFLAKKFTNNATLVIPVLMFVFAAIDAFIGMPEFCIIYLPIVMPLMIRLGFDSITAMATVLLGSTAGFTAALTNPFTIAIGQNISGLPLYSGFGYRLITFVVIYAIGAVYVMRYGKKVRLNPQSSSMYEEDFEKRQEVSQVAASTKLNLRQKLAAVYSAAMFVTLFVLLIKLGWDIPEMSAMFLLLGVGAGIIAGLKMDEMCSAFVTGCRGMIYGAMIVAIGRGITVVMSDGNITDAVVHGLATLLTNMPPALTVLGIFLAVTIFNFFMASGSGKAVIFFPLLVPLADVLGITRQTVVLAYQFGDGFTNTMWPTAGTLNACLGIAGIPWQKWAKFYFPLICVWYAVASVFLLIAQAISWGPF